MKNKIKIVKYLDNPPSYIEVPADTPQEEIDRRVKKLQDQYNDEKKSIYDSFEQLRDKKPHNRSIQVFMEERSGIIEGKRMF